MKILSINAGSSSLKFQLYEMPEEKILISGVFERIGIENSFYTVKLNDQSIKNELTLKNHEEAFKLLVEELLKNNIVKDLGEISAVGHRTVQGGSSFTHSVIITDEVLAKIEEFIPLAPLHNPANIVGIKACKKIIPKAVQVAIFDTAFHQTINEENYLYALPKELYLKYGIRKYGYHGISHQYVSQKMNEILDRNDTKLITCHIGNGGSISAIENGKCINTSMGLTPNSGLIMGSRCGDIDATILLYLQKKGFSLEELDEILNKKSGLFGISGISSDLRDISKAIDENHYDSILAQKMYVNRIVEYIAKYYVEMNGCDAIIFTAGVGENSALIRQLVMDKLTILGVKIDDEKNKNGSGNRQISSNESSILCYIIKTDEELMMARDTYNLI